MTTVKKTSIYKKLADARHAFHKLELKKTGKNKYAGYSYFELGDFLVEAIECLRDEGLIAIPTFDAEYASLNIFETDGGEGTITITSPMKEANLKGCHPIQNLGAVETYQIRYLWVALMAICEHDGLDSQEPLKEEPKKAPVKKAPLKSVPKEDDGISVPHLEDEEEAKLYAGKMIQIAKEMHSTSMGALVDFWKKNIAISNYLKESFPQQYTELTTAFAEIKASIKEQSND